MNLLKMQDYFDPDLVRGTIHIIGCGSVGSTVAELLARYGVKNMILHDNDVVESKNIVNQMFREKDIHEQKTIALRNILKEINPDLKVTCCDKWDEDTLVNGYVFICVDSMETRQRIAHALEYNSNIRLVMDFRTGLTTADCFACRWNDYEARQKFLKSMNYRDSDVENPVSACGNTLGVAGTVRLISTCGVCNFIEFVRSYEKYLKTMINIDIENITVFSE